MPRRTEELVNEIRTRRRRVRVEVEELLSTEDLARRVRRDPAAWIAGGALLGILAGRFFGRPLLDGGRRHLAAEMRARVGPAIAAAIVAGLGRGAEPRAPAATAGDAPRTPPA